MPTIKIACPDCGQRVSGDESFLGTTVPCPSCDTPIVFPEKIEDIPASPPAATETPPPLKEKASDETLLSPPSEHLSLRQDDDNDPKPKPAVYKVNCPTCDQRVSGDESFLGTTVPCPTCETSIVFPKDLSPSAETPANTPPAEETVGKLNVVSFEKPILKDPDAFDEDDYIDDEPKKPSLPKAPKGSGSKKTLPRAVAPAPTTPDNTPAAAPGARVSKAAVLALILGLTSLFFLPFLLGLLLLIPGLLFGHTARARIKNSSGRLLGKGLATTGLCFSYLTLILVIITAGTLIAFKGKDRATQFYNASQAPIVLAALGAYAESHQGRYPSTLTELIPDYLPEEQRKILNWMNPDGLEPIPYLYYPGHDLLLDDATTIIIAAPEPDGLNRRLVGYLNTEAELIPEDDFLTRMGAVEKNQ
ncbi:MAG: DUF4190 domain-containing protein [Verrucomicrobiota bacterium]